MNLPIITEAIRQEQDIVLARKRARQIAGLLGFDENDQTRIATAVSEIARNAYKYAGEGRIQFFIDSEKRSQSLWVSISDQGPGIADLEQILTGQHHSTTGIGLGI